MLLQTNSYIVPPEHRAAHARLLTQFRQTLARLGCDMFDIYEQVGANWDPAQSSGRFVQIMRFRDRNHQLAIQAAEQSDKEAQDLIARFCELINFPYQREHGLFAVGFYTNILATEPGFIAEKKPAIMRIAREETDSHQNGSPESDPFALDEAPAEVSGSGIGQILDATLLEDELNLEMPAELLDESEA